VDGDLMDNNAYSGSTFDEFLAEEGILEEVSTKAQKRLLALQIEDIMAEANLTKIELAAKMQTSRSQLDRLLDPDNTSITLDSLDRLARAVGKRLKIEFA
jgi:DNA-binding Xre family transcriptional regulator